jgi:hypothetical protein
VTIDRARVAAIVQAGLEHAGVTLDAVELAQLESQTAMMLEGLEQLNEMKPLLEQAEPALTFVVTKPSDNE